MTRTTSEWPARGEPATRAGKRSHEGAVRWRLIRDEPLDGPMNMAVDETLFRSVRAGGAPILRLYRWDPPCVSLGRNEPAAGMYDAAAAAARGIDFVRRPTGGQAVYHRREVTYAVAVPVGLLGGARATYDAINVALARGLSRLGVAAARVAPQDAGSRAVRRDRLRAGVCFRAPAAGEVVVRGRKLIGSAQRFERDAILQHGSILLEDEQSEIHHVMTGTGVAGRGSGGGSAIGLREVLGASPTPAAVGEAIVAGFEATCGAMFDDDSLDGAERRLARDLVRNYRSDAWTWRR